MFEQFPYADMQQLNLDWIIKITKDFLDQYTSIQQIISDGMTGLQEKYDTLENLLNAWYETHSEDIANQLTDALEDLTEALNTALGTFETDATNITNAVIATIPADYTDLSNDVSMLKKNPPDLFSLLTEWNYNTNYALAAVMDETAYGITVKNDSNIFTINGTATGNVDIPIFNSRTKAYQFPFKPGRTYNFKFNETAGSELITKVVRYKASEDAAWSTQTANANRNDAITIVLPATYYEFEISFIVASGASYTDKTVEIFITNQVKQLRQFDNLITSGIVDGRIHYNDISPVKNSNSPNWSGVDISNDGYNINIQGTANANRAYELIRDYTGELIKGGSMLRIVYDPDGTNATLEVKYRTTGGDIVLFQTASKGTYFPEFPTGVTQVIIDIVLFNGTTYNNTIYYDVTSVPAENNFFTVDQTGNGDFKTIKSAVEIACKRLNSTVVVNAGTYDLVAEFGKSFLDNLNDNAGYYGLMLYNGIHLIFSPFADVYFDYDGANPWVIANFSPFNTGNSVGFTLEGLNINARNCRYIVHDDPRPGVKENHSRNIYRNCYFTMFPSPDYPTWPNHQIIGGGFGDQTEIEIDSCIFRDTFTDDVDHYAAVSYHNSTSGNASYKSYLVIKNCMFYPKNRIVVQGYGSSTVKTPVMICGNAFDNAQTDIVYDNTVDNLIVHRWNNQNR